MSCQKRHVTMPPKWSEAPSDSTKLGGATCKGYYLPVFRSWLMSTRHTLKLPFLPVSTEQMSKSAPQKGKVWEHFKCLLGREGIIYLIGGSGERTDHVQSIPLQMLQHLFFYRYLLVFSALPCLILQGPVCPCVGTYGCWNMPAFGQANLSN